MTDDTHRHPVPASNPLPSAGLDRLLNDIKSPGLLYTKAALFVLGGIIASVLILLQLPTVAAALKVAVLLGVAVWCFARAYYFAFYVIGHYIDPSYRFSSLWAFARYVARKRRDKDSGGTP